MVGLSCAVLAGALWSVKTTIVDRGTILREANTMARSEPVREEFARQIAVAIVPHSAVSDPTVINAANDTARQAVKTPEFQAAFTAVVPELYSQVVDGGGADVVLDHALINEAITSTGTAMPEGLELRIEKGVLPDLRRTLEIMGRAATVLGAVAALLIGIGLALSSHRGRAVMRIGRWLVTVGIGTIVVFWALPTLALLPLGGWISLFGIVLVTGDWLAVPAAVLTAIGIAIVVIGSAEESEERRRRLAVIPTTSGRNPTHPSIG